MAGTIGRLFYEVGAKSTVRQDLADAITSFQSFNQVIDTAGKRYLTNFLNFIQPTKQLGQELELLEKAGAKPAHALAFLGERFQTTIDQARKLGEAIPKNVLEMEAYAKQTQKTGLSFENLGKSITDFAHNPLQAAQSGITGMLESIGPLAVGIGGIATAAIGAGVGLLKFAADTAATAEQLQNLSIQTGLTTQDLQALQEIGKEKGLDLDLAKQLGKLNKELADVKGTGADFVRVLNALRYAQGLPAADLSSGLIPALVELRTRVLAIEDPFERAKVQNAAFGKGMMSLQPIVFDASRSIEDMMVTMKKTDAVWGPDAQAKLMAYDEFLDRLSITWRGLKNDIAIATVTALKWTDVIDVAKQSMSAQDMYQQWAKTGQGLPQFGKSKFVNMGGAEGDAFADVASALARADAIASGTKVAIELTIKLKQAEQEYAAAKKDNDVQEATRLANKIAGLKIQIKAVEESSKKEDEAAKAAIENWKAGAKDLQGMLTIVNATADEWVILSKRIDEATKASKEFNKIAEDLYFTTTAAMAKADQSWFKGALDSLPKITPSVRKEMDQILRVNTDTGKDIAAIWKRQISTIVSDFSRGFADILFAGKSFGETLKNIFIDIGKSIVRTMVEILFQPLEKYLIKILTGMMGLKVAAGSTGSSGDWGGETGTGTIGAGGMSKGSAVLLGGTGAYMGVKGMFDPGVKGWAETIGGGAALGAAIGSFLPGVGTAIGALTGAMWATIAKSIQAMVRGIMGKDAWTAGVMEAARDLGGIQIGKDAFASFFKNIGINEATAYPIRKDLMFSPAYLTQIAGPAAEQQGKMDAFLKSLEHISVDSKIAASGFINLRTAYEAGIKTGDFSELNKQYQDLFKNSKALTAAFPEFMDKLAAAADITWKMSAATLAAYKGFTNIRDVISQSIAPIDDMYGTFAKTGLITAEFAAKITELGGDLQKFRDLGALVEINSEFGDLVKHFQDTGEILPGLRDLFKQFGGDLKALDDAAALPGLKAGLAGINDLISGMKALQPQAMAIQDLFKGVLNTEGLLALGLDPAKLKPFADLTKMMQGWDQAVQQFQQAGKLETGGILSQGLSQYGGQAGAAAMANYQAGFNTITSSLLASTKAAMDASYQDTIKAALDYLGTIQKETSDKITTLTTAVETELGKVNTSITTALNSAKTDVVAVLNAILAQLGGTPVEATGTTPAVTSPVTGPPIQQPVMPHAGPTIIIQGPVYGFDDFAAQVERAGITLQRRGSPVFAT